MACKRKILLKVLLYLIIRYYNVIKTAREAGVTLISDWGFRDDVPYGNWRKDQKAWLVNKDYSKKEAFYSVLKALYEPQK